MTRQSNTIKKALELEPDHATSITKIMQSFYTTSARPMTRQSNTIKKHLNLNLTMQALTEIMQPF